MKKRYRRYETLFNRLVLHSMDNPDAVGLLAGQTGILITIARYARATGREELETIADTLFENVTAKATRIRDISFGYGLSGICWGVEYLVQNGIMPGDADEICSDIDAFIIKQPLVSVDGFSLETGLTGLWHYVQARIQGNLKAGLPIPFPAEYLYEWLSILKTDPDKFPQASAAWLKGAMNGEPVEFIGLNIADFVKLPPGPDPRDLSLRSGVAGELELRYLCKGKILKNIAAPHKHRGNKTHLIFVDENNSSRQNGIGTFRDILLPPLAASGEVLATLVSFNSGVDNLTISRHDFGTEIALPPVAGGNWRGNGGIIWPLLRMYIPDSDWNVAMFNHSPCAENITAMKRVFPLSKVVFVIHDQGWCARLFGDGNLLAAIERGETPPEVSESTCNFVRGYCASEREIYHIADAVVCLSESTRKLLHEVYKVPDQKITLIYNGYPADRKGFVKRDAARHSLGLNNDDELLLFVARSAPHKGIRAILTALEKVRKRHPGVRCALAGNPKGFTDHWDLGSTVAANLILPGHLTKEALRVWYSAADTGVLSSYTEQCSYAALEMMNAGIAIVSSDGNGLCDMFTDGKNAYVAHIGDVTDADTYSSVLAGKICEALDAGTAERKRLGTAARRLLKKKYSCATMVAQYIALFKRIVGDHCTR